MFCWIHFWNKVNYNKVSILNILINLNYKTLRPLLHVCQKVTPLFITVIICLVCVSCIFLLSKWLAFQCAFMFVLWKFLSKLYVRNENGKSKKCAVSYCLITFILVCDKKAQYRVIILSHFQFQTLCRVDFMHFEYHNQLCASVFMHNNLLFQCLNPNVFIFKDIIIQKTAYTSNCFEFYFLTWKLFDNVHFYHHADFLFTVWQQDCTLRFLTFYRFLQGWELTGRSWSFTMSPDTVMESTSVWRSMTYPQPSIASSA